MYFLFCVHPSLWPSTWLPTPLSMILLISSALSQHQTLGFIPRLWTNPSLVLDLPPILAPDPFLTQLALLIIWLQLLHLGAEATSPCITTQWSALWGSINVAGSFFALDSFSLSFLLSYPLFPLPLLPSPLLPFKWQCGIVKSLWNLELIKTVSDSKMPSCFVALTITYI